LCNRAEILSLTPCFSTVFPDPHPGFSPEWTHAG